MSLRTLILIIINSLIFLVILMLSITFYKQFSNVLDDRILLQLNSIKTLKQIQVENLINDEWQSFLNSDNKSTQENLNINIPRSAYKASGVYDFTKFSADGKTSIGLVSVDDNQTRIGIIDYEKIKSILLERTGMGNTGESYLVGEDLYMRSQSRFLSSKVPSSILVNTEGVNEALTGNSGRGVFNDYRNVEVYSVYSPISISNLKLVILSEIDKSEVVAPLVHFKKEAPMMVS